MLWYSCSSIGLCCYFVRNFRIPPRGSCPLFRKYKDKYPNRVEVVVLPDGGTTKSSIISMAQQIAHHTATLFGAYCAFNVKSCHDFAYILSQTNILHVPMLLWYFGCKKGCFLKSNSALKRACIFLFPHV